MKDRIGVCLQATNLPDKITVHEALELFGSLLLAAGRWRRAAADVCSSGKSARPDYATLSGGQKQRLALALALINDPQMLFLDEPTTGLDPQVRLEIRDLIEELRAEKRTILMTTHYIEEAERLCDRVAIIDDGVIIAHRIAAGVAGEKREPIEHRDSLRRSLCRTRAIARRGRKRFARIVSDDRRADLSRLATSGADARRDGEVDRCQGLELEDVHLKRPTLEDVFIELTGKKLRD